MKIRIEVDNYSFPVEIPAWLWWIIQQYEV
jgi:hypothetical protein